MRVIDPDLCIQDCRLDLVDDCDNCALPPEDEAESDLLTAKLVVLDGHHIKLTVQQKILAIQVGVKAGLLRDQLVVRLGFRNKAQLMKFVWDHDVALPVDPPKPLVWVHKYQAPHRNRRAEQKAVAE